MLVRLALVWLSMVVPAFAAVAIGGPVGLLPHVVFHPIYLACLVVTIVLAWRLRASTAHRGIRVLAAVVAVTSAIAFVGQAGEEAVVIAHGGMDAPDHLLEEADHLGWAIVGMLGGLFPSMFAISALSVVAGVSLLRSGRRGDAEASRARDPGDARGWAALAPGVVYVADFALAVAGVRFSQMYGLTLCATIALLAVAVVTRSRPCALDRAREPLPAASASAILAP